MGPGASHAGRGMKNGTRSHGSMRSMAGCVGGLGKGGSMRSGKGRGGGGRGGEATCLGRGP